MTLETMYLNVLVGTGNLGGVDGGESGQGR